MTPTEADYVFFELWVMFYHKKDYFKYLGDTPTLNELTNHFKVQPKAIKKLEAYGLVKILDKGDEKVVIIYRQQILAAGENSLVIS